MEFKTFAFDVKASEGNQGIIEGYAATFGNVDQQHDIIEPGAFTKTLREHPNIPVLSSHDEVIGVQEEAKEDEHGLWVRGQLVMEVPRAASDYALVKAGAIRGMSIGFRVMKDEWDREREIRRLKEVRLFEWSLTPFPANEEARISVIKAFDSIETATAWLKKHPALAKSQVYVVREDESALLRDPGEPPHWIEPDALHSLRAVLHSLHEGA